jgi:hypothetical protein
MKIQVAKQDLEAALQVVNAAMGSGDADNIQTHYVFRAVEEDGDLKGQVLTYSGRLSAVAPFVSKVEVDDGEAREFTIEGFRLKALMKYLPDEAMVFDFDGSDTTYKGPSHGPGQRYRSIDPAKYPFWDSTLDDAEVKATVAAPALRRAFNWARLFVMKGDETRRPDLTVFECREGILYSTNMKSVALVTVPGLEESQIRVCRDDATKLMSFLDTAGEEDIEVLETDRALFLRRSDGSVFSETRHPVSFPKNISVGGKVGEDPIWWEISVDTLNFHVGMLSTVADKVDNRLRFKPNGDNSVLLEIHNVDGNGTSSRPCAVTTGTNDDDVEVSDKGFLLDRNELKELISINEGDVLRLGVHPRGQSGFVRVSHEVDGVDCQVILAWLKD